MKVILNNFSRRNYFVKQLKLQYTVMHFRLTDLCRILYIEQAEVEA
jgi:hypothetical protein